MAMMSPRTVRRVVVVVCVLGIGGMIAGSIADNSGAALTAGLVTAAASLCLMVATAVAAPTPAMAGAGAEAQAAAVEEQVAVLVRGGADEAEVRALVGAAVALGRTRAR